MHDSDDRQARQEEDGQEEGDFETRFEHTL
jgi:hypothetical protein